jgi:septal ring factor EnvC (AmiA/AmiB activator)
MRPRIPRWLAPLALCAVAIAAAAAGPSPQTARELDAVKERIRGLEKEIARAAAAKPTAGKALQQAEAIEADARNALRDVRRQLEEGRARERALRAGMARAEAELADHRQALEAQLRLAYAAGREEWLRLALSQQDPVALSRRVVYYGYITKQRSALLADVEGEIAALEAAAAALKAELEALADLDRRREARVREVTAARQVRAQALQTIDRDLGSRREKLKRLQREARGLEQLMARLERESRAAAAAVKPPPAPGSGGLPDTTGPALKVNGLPLQGRAVARFGQPRADGLLRWDGMVLAAPAGTEVRAVRPGRVVYADWLPGMGQLIVIDHGKGLMSLYGHNQELLRQAGQGVRQGEVVSRVGDSGGQGTPGLYFEVRRNGKPVNPAPFVK